MKSVTHPRQSCWLLIGALFFIGSVHLDCESKKPLRIGFVAGTSGRVADLGISGLDAVQMAVEQCNQDGGIGGRRVELRIKNDRQDPDTARQVVQELIDENVMASIGPMTSAMAVAVAPLLNAARILHVSPTATTQQLSGRDDYFFRVSATTREYASRSARYQITSGNMRRISAAYDTGNRSFSENWLENFKAPFTAKGGEIIATIGFNTKETRSFSE